MKGQETPYDNAIHKIKQLHGEALADFLTCDEGDERRREISRECDEVQVILELLEYLKGQHENNLRSSTG